MPTPENRFLKTEKSLDDYTPDIDNTSRYASAALELRFEKTLRNIYPAFTLTALRLESLSFAKSGLLGVCLDHD